MMNKSLRGRAEESSDISQYGFRLLRPIDDGRCTPSGLGTARKRKKKPPETGGLRS
jgi:hypothetical protein